MTHEALRWVTCRAKMAWQQSDGVGVDVGDGVGRGGAVGCRGRVACFWIF
jgi:hypothetical protein